MAVIYMKHQYHGNKVACSEEEAELDEKRGWKRYEVKSPIDLLKTPEEVDAFRARMAEDEARSMVAWRAKQEAERKAGARKRG